MKNTSKKTVLQWAPLSNTEISSWHPLDRPWYIVALNLWSTFTIYVFIHLNKIEVTVGNSEITAFQ